MTCYKHDVLYIVGINVSRLREVIDEVVLKKLSRIPQNYIPRLCKELSQSELVDPERDSCDGIVEDLTAAIEFQNDPSEIISYCTVLFRAIESVSGRHRKSIAGHLKRNLTQAIRDEFHIDVNFDRC